jgi:putative transposase
MSKGTTTSAVPSSDDGEGGSGVLAAVAPAGADARRVWAQALVDRARSEGVALTGEDGLLTSMVREVLQAGLDVEMSEHLGYEPYELLGRNSGNSRNGSYPKTVKTDVGPVELRMPRDREGTFDPVTVPKHVRRLEGLGANVLSLYAKGLTTGEIQAHLAEIYDTEISRETISKITDAVLPEMTAWQSRPLERIYPVLLIDAIVVKVRGSQVANRPVYVAVGVNLESERDVLGLWIGPSGGEGAKQWMSMLTELKNRGVADALVVCCDGLKGLPDAIRVSWPEATVQTCVVHLVRNSLRYASRNRLAGSAARMTITLGRSTHPLRRSASRSYDVGWVNVQGSDRAAKGTARASAAVPLRSRVPRTAGNSPRQASAFTRVSRVFRAVLGVRTYRGDRI